METNMQKQNQLTTEDLITLIRKDCHRQAESIQKKLTEVTECLHEENHLGALGAFAALDDDIVCLKVFLTRIATLTVGEAGWMVCRDVPNAIPEEKPPRR
jgi:hypothetical protein